MKLSDTIPFDNSNCSTCRGKGDADTCGECSHKHDEYNKKMGYNGTWTWCEKCNDHTKGCEHEVDQSV